MGCGPSKTQETQEAELEKLRQESERLSQANASLTRQLIELQGQMGKQRQASNEFLKNDGELEVTRLKTYQGASCAIIDFALANRSDQFIEAVGFGADIYDSGGAYLGHYEVVLPNLGPHSSITYRLLYANVSAALIATWKPAIKSVVVGGPGGVRINKTRNFILREARFGKDF